MKQSVRTKGGILGREDVEREAILVRIAPTSRLHATVPAWPLNETDRAQV
jgi:hypothetical protein